MPDDYNDGNRGGGSGIIWLVLLALAGCIFWAFTRDVFLW